MEEPVQIGIGNGTPPRNRFLGMLLSEQEIKDLLGAVVCSKCGEPVSFCLSCYKQDLFYLHCHSCGKVCSDYLQ